MMSGPVLGPNKGSAVKSFLFSSFGAVLSVICLPIAPLDAQSALPGLATDMVPEDLAHLPGDAGDGTSGIPIRRGNGFAPVPSLQPTNSARSAFFASTSKGVSVNNLPFLTTVITRENSLVLRIGTTRNPRSVSRQKRPSLYSGCRARAKPRGRTSSRSSVRHSRFCGCSNTRHAAFANRSCAPLQTGIFLRRQR